MLDYEEARLQALARMKQLKSRETVIRSEQEKLDEELESVTREINGLNLILSGLEEVSDNRSPEVDVPGITDHIRKILQWSTVHLLPTQIRDSCESVGIKGSSSKNLLITVHNVLDRLQPNLEMMEIQGKKAYRWKRSPTLGLCGLVPPSGFLGTATPELQRQNRPAYKRRSPRRRKPLSTNHPTQEDKK